MSPFPRQWLILKVDILSNRTAESGHQFREDLHFNKIDFASCEHETSHLIKREIIVKLNTI